ncbi:uncharacterized protein LTR77_004355 [Saxophila tyrrhenica]|uniref:Uncharacterized protein n=1 Tax=Saxophila tyrrhenica TaxID=1690608 RepID=A0AAV9PCX1_9PEZI|nr:hypothetical protein LTR77_004355 [Saxophila tyrrhenica]
MSSLFKSKTTFDPIYSLLNADEDKERDELTQRWKDNKLQELSFIGVVGGLLANVLTSTNSWPDVLQNGRSTPWVVRSCWFCGIIFALASVLTAASQSIRLHRMSCRPDANASIRGLLGIKSLKSNGEKIPRRAQVWIWQMGVLYLMISVLFMIIGMLALVWAAVGGQNWWNGQAQLAITFSVAAAVVAGLFVWEQVNLFAWDESSEGSSVRLS